VYCSRISFELDITVIFYFTSKQLSDVFVSVFRDGAVGIATPYRLDDPSIEYWRGEGGSEFFHACTDRPRGPPIILYHGCPLCFPGLK